MKQFIATWSAFVGMGGGAISIGMAFAGQDPKIIAGTLIISALLCAIALTLDD